MPGETRATRKSKESVAALMGHGAAATMNWIMIARAANASAAGARHANDPSASARSRELRRHHWRRRRRADGLLRRVARRPIAGQHRQPASRRVRRHPAVSRGDSPCRNLGRFDPVAARMAVSAAFGRVHQARTVEPARLEGDRSRLAPDHRVPDRVATLDEHSYLYGRPGASARVRGAYVGRLLDGHVGRRSLARQDDAHERGLLPAQRRAAERQSDADGVPDAPPLSERGLPDVGHRRVRPRLL